MIFGEMLRVHMTCAAQRPRMPKVEKGQRLGRVTLTGGGGEGHGAHSDVVTALLSGGQRW